MAKAVTPAVVNITTVTAEKASDGRKIPDELRERMVAEIPTIWLDRTIGKSSFQLVSWLPRYLRWYRYAFGPRLPIRA